MFKEAVKQKVDLLIGDDRRNSLEHRMFNIISLLNAVANLGGAAPAAAIDHGTLGFWLGVLHLVTGVLFAVFFYLSRFRNIYRPLYWPFILTMLAFLFGNVIANAGSMGGAHYYLITALVIATILAPRRKAAVRAFVVFPLSAMLLFFLERLEPDWIMGHTSTSERMLDVSSNFIFAQLFTGILVLVLKNNFNNERSKSDALLRNVLPASIARELITERRVMPRHYASASVLFTDFVGFTRIAERLEPQELISELDSCFRAFDQIVKKHSLEKIKTIGDSYMATGGVPTPNRSHPVDCVLAALEIIELMKEKRVAKLAQERDYWELRLGIHTGPLVAGVIGDEKFAYDVWGDTVNTASRMESGGIPGRINISQVTFEMVRDFFDCEYRGEVEVKNKDAVKMYLVKSVRLELSRNGNGRTPNERFFDKYRNMGRSEADA